MYIIELSLAHTLSYIYFLFIFSKRVLEQIKTNIHFISTGNLKIFYIRYYQLQISRGKNLFISINF